MTAAPTSDLPQEIWYCDHCRFVAADAGRRPLKLHECIHLPSLYRLAEGASCDRVRETLALLEGAASAAARVVAGDYDTFRFEPHVEIGVQLGAAITAARAALGRDSTLERVVITSRDLR